MKLQHNFRIEFFCNKLVNQKWRNELKGWMILSATLLGGTACFAGTMGATESDLMRDGLFIGLGTNYN